MIRRQHPLVVALFAILLPGLFSLAVGEGELSAQPSANEDIVINEVHYRGVGSADDWIEIRNTGSQTIDVGNWWFCARFDYGQVGLLPIINGDDYILTPGEILVVRPWTDLDDNASDLGLYIDSNFFSATSMVDFVQWGSGAAIGRGSVAVAKGIWRELSPGQYDFVPRSADGQTLAWRGINSGSGLLTHSTDWQNGAPSQGQDNAIPQLTSTPTLTPTATQSPTVTPTPTLTPTAATVETPTPTPTGTSEAQKSTYLPLLSKH
ncbi:MAG: lamin tail domain-containing protein [Caldilineaceae bacterium]|nr:lamin tail domain-containing protein [Caldilineaceae bacterium]